MQSSHTSVDFDLEQIFNDEAQYDINNWDDNILVQAMILVLIQLCMEKEKKKIMSMRRGEEAGDHEYNNNNDDARITKSRNCDD